MRFRQQAKRSRCLIPLIVFTLACWSLFHSLSSSPPPGPTPHPTAALFPLKDISLGTSHSEHSNSNASTVTLVTAYFDLANSIGEKKIKHSHKFYLDTGKVLLSIKTPMIIFTDVDLIATSRAELAPSSPTHVIKMSLSDLDVVKKHLEALTLLHRKDLEPHLYSPPLYALYHAKPEMMRIAAQLNPFSTRKLMWVDFGSMRDYGGIEAKDYRNHVWPRYVLTTNTDGCAARPDRIPLLGQDGHVLIQGTGGVTPRCQVNWTNADPTSPGPTSLPVVRTVSEVYETPMFWIAGALFGGDAEALIAYDQVYMQALAEYLDSGRSKRAVALIDQHLMGAVACVHPELVHRRLSHD